MKIVLKSKEFIAISVVLLLLLFVFSIGTRSIGYSSPDEKRYVQSAKEMVASGDWITPQYHGRARFQKPILFYWLAASSVTLFGQTWLGARFPSSLCGIMVVLFTYLLGRALYNRRTGIFSALLLIVSMLFFTYTRLATPDMATLFFITLSIYLFCKLYFQDAPKPTGYIFFISLALATLTKGPVGLFIPLITVTIFTLIFKREGLAKRIDIPIGILLFFLVVFPWFALMVKIHGDKYIQHIWQIETIKRAGDLWTEGGNILYKISKGFGRYLAMTFIAFLPSTLFLPGAIIDSLRRKRIKTEEMLLIIWVFTVIVFFTLVGTKKVHYLVSLAPPLALFMGNYLERFTERRRNLRLVQVFIAAALLVYLFLFGYFIPTLSREDGLLVLSQKILAIREEGERVGIGSHFISHNRVDSYLGINVKKVSVDLYDPDEQIRTSKAILSNFLKSKDRVFCLITRQDYEDYIPDKFKGRTFVLDKGWYWKKPNQLKFDKDLLEAVLKGDKRTLAGAVKNEIYLISNSP